MTPSIEAEVYGGETEGKQLTISEAAKEYDKGGARATEAMATATEKVGGNGGGEKHVTTAAAAPPPPVPTLKMEGGVKSIYDNAAEALNTLAALRSFIDAEFKVETDYGLIPGTRGKVLLLPGAQKVAMFFKVRPVYDIERDELGHGHVEYRVTTRFLDEDGNEQGRGIGSCSTKEAKYAQRNASRVCPACGQDKIIKGKEEYGGGYVCWAKDKSGCGAKYADNDPKITGQKVGKTENENIHDERNTVLKMGKKRSYIDGAIEMGCLSGEFTQDLDEKIDTSASEDTQRAAAGAQVSVQREAPTVSGGKKLSEGEYLPTSVKTEGGKKKDGSPWQKWIIETVDHAGEVKLFSAWKKAYAERAEKAIAEKLAVKIAATQTRWGWDIDELDILLVLEEQRTA